MRTPRFICINDVSKALIFCPLVCFARNSIVFSTRPTKDAAVKSISCLMSLTPFREPLTPDYKKSVPASPCWTPGMAVNNIPESYNGTVRAYNSAMDEIAKLVSPPVKREPLVSQLKLPLKTVSEKDKSKILEKASEDCLLVCKIMSPLNGEELFESMIRSKEEKTNDCPVSEDLVVLMTAYKNASTRNLKRQILSLYAYRYPVCTLQKVHEPFENLSTWQIKQARLHARSCGPGSYHTTEKQHRV